MSFGMVLCGIFCPPAYFALRGRWVVAAVHGVLYLLALLCVFSVIGFVFGVILWLFGYVHAMWDLRAVVTEKAIQRQAEAIAEKMQAAAKPPPPPMPSGDAG